MRVFDHPEFDDHEAVTFARDADSGLLAIIAVHSTVLGPAVGGCRMWPYADEGAALADVLRLSRGMSFKSALAGLPFGGGKSVVIGDPARSKTPAMMRALGRAVDRLGGSYTIAEDVGTSPADMAEIARETAHVRGLDGHGGDPSPATAWGVLQGMKATVRHALGRDSLSDLTVAVQGLGHVGMELCRLLHEDGARLIVADISTGAVAAAGRDFGARACPPDRIHAAEADIFAPCALGAVLNDRSIPEIKARIIAGAANNQLAEARHGPALAQRGIVYAPDYVINAGGIIHIHHEGAQYDRAAAFAHVAMIAQTTEAVFALAKQEGLDPATAADLLARRRIGEAGRVRHARAS